MLDKLLQQNLPYIFRQKVFPYFFTEHLLQGLYCAEAPVYISWDMQQICTYFRRMAK